MFLGASSADGQTAQEVAKKAFGSTVLPVMEDANGQPLSLGSGFFVRDGEVASNLHVVEGAARGYAKLVGQKTKYDIEGITTIDPQRDLVVIKISASGSPTLALGSSDAVQVGESIYAVGNPQGLEGTFSQGIVSSIREVGTDKLLQITAPISPGSSGGPVLNGKGEVIGISVATFRGGQNLNFAIPSDYLTTLLGKVVLPSHWHKPNRRTLNGRFWQTSEDEARKASLGRNSLGPYPEISSRAVILFRSAINYGTTSRMSIVFLCSEIVRVSHWMWMLFNSTA